MATLVDSNVILDIVTEDEAWLDWSANALEKCAESGPLVINPIVFAEVSVGFASIEALEDALPGDFFVREALPWDSAFLAGKAFAVYKRRAGTRPHTLPDFYIGAHAAVSGHALLTRDPRRYRSYFPSITLIAP